MNIVIELDDEIHKALELYSARENQSVSAVIDRALRQYLDENRPNKRRLVKLTTSSGHGLQSDVDLDNNAELLDLMEEDMYIEYRSNQ